MKHMLLFELKRVFRSKLTWFLVMFLVFLSLVSLSIISKRESEKRYEGFSYNSCIEVEDILSYEIDGVRYDGIRDDLKMPYPLYMNWARMKYDVQKALSEAYRQGNYRESIRNEAIHSIIEAKRSYGNDEIALMSFDRTGRALWTELGVEEAYESFDARPFTDFHGFAPLHALMAKYYTRLYKSNQVPMYHWDINTHTYLSAYFYRYLPLLLGAITILFTFNSINREKASGSLKLMMIQGNKRWHYYLSKWLSGVLAVSLVVLIPCVLITGSLMVMGKGQPLNYPIAGLEKGMKTLKPIPNYMDAQNEKLNLDSVDKPVLAPLPPKSLGTDLGVSVPSTRVQWMDFGSYMLVTLVLTLLYIAFTLAFVLLISALINNQVLSFVVSAGLYTLATLISRPFTMGEHWNLSPFGMSNSFRIVNGSYNVTALMACLVLAASTAFLLSIGMLYFKKKAI